MSDMSILDEYINQLDVDAWYDQMTPEDRLNELQKLENTMAAKDHREPVTIKVLPEKAAEEQPGLQGCFTQEKNEKVIYIRPDFLVAKRTVAGSVSPYSIAKAMGTIIHEGRHAWQHYVIEHPEKNLVDEKTLRQIQMSIVNYHAWGYQDDDVEFAYYQAKLIEVDARRYQRENLEYISQKLAEKNGVPDRFFVNAIEQCISREVEEAFMLQTIFNEADFDALDEVYRDFMKEIEGVEDVDYSDISAFEDIRRFLQTGDIQGFVEGKSLEQFDGKSEGSFVDKPDTRFMESLAAMKTRAKKYL